jgi:hypothetical protein
VNLVEAMARSQSHDEIVHCEAAQDEIDGLLAEAEGYVDLTHQYGHWDVWGTDDDGVPWRLAISLERQPAPRAACCDGECGGIRSRCEEWGERDAEDS